MEFLPQVFQVKPIVHRNLAVPAARGDFASFTTFPRLGFVAGSLLRLLLSLCRALQQPDEERLFFQLLESLLCPGLFKAIGGT